MRKFETKKKVKIQKGCLNCNRKGGRSSRRSSKLNNNQMKIRINIENLDQVYDILRSSKVVDFVKRYAFVNIEKSFHLTKFTKLVMTGKSFIEYRTPQKWDQILCRELSPDIKISPCNVPGRPLSDNWKIFFRLASNWHEFILKLHSGEITREQHHAFWKVLYEAQKLDSDLKFFNHNQDVNIVHIKAKNPTESAKSHEFADKLIKRSMKKSN